MKLKDGLFTFLLILKIILTAIILLPIAYFSSFVIKVLAFFDSIFHKNYN